MTTKLSTLAALLVAVVALMLSLYATVTSGLSVALPLVFISLLAGAVTYALPFAASPAAFVGLLDVVGPVDRHPVTLGLHSVDSNSHTGSREALRGLSKAATSPSSGPVSPTPTPAAVAADGGFIALLESDATLSALRSAFTEQSPDRLAVESSLYSGRASANGLLWIMEQYPSLRADALEALEAKDPSYKGKGVPAVLAEVRSKS